MRRFRMSLRPAWSSGAGRCATAVVAVGLVGAACGGGGGEKDPVAAAQADVAKAQSGLDRAESQLASDGQEFCGATKDYVAAIDRYGKLFTDSATTVGDIKAG